MIGEYGSGTFTGTTAYTLAVDSSGNIIETTDGGGDITGSGTANTVAKFTGAKAIGDGPITFATNDSTFAGAITVQSGNKLILNRPNNAIDCELSTDSSDTLILNSRNSEGFKFQNNGTNFVTGDSSSNVTFAGSVTAVGISSTIASATSGYFATGTAIPANQILHVRDNVGQVATNSAGGIKISSSPGNDVFLLKRNNGATSYFALQNSSGTEFITTDMASWKRRNWDNFASL